MNTRLVTDRGIQKCTTAVRLSGIFSGFAMHVVNAFGVGVVRLQLSVRNRPGRRDPAEMFYLSKIFFTETKQRRAVKFGVAADIIIRVRMQLCPIDVPPKLFGVIAAAGIHLQSTDRDKAERYLLEAVRLDPNFTLAYLTLGSLCMDEERVSDAIKYLQLYLQMEKSPQAAEMVAEVKAVVEGLREELKK